MLSNPRIKRSLIGCLVFVVVLFGGVQIYRYLTTGRLTVTTNRNEGYIRILNQNSQEVGELKQSHKLSERLKPGRYSVMAYAGSAYTDKIVTLDARQKINLDLQLNDPQIPEPVIGEKTIDVSADSENLYSIDPSDGDLDRIGDQGTVSTVNDTHIFKKARWASPGTGAVMDDSSSLYAVSGGSVTSLPLPFPINNNPSIDFDITPDGVLYVSNGQDVYSGTLAGNFTKIYSSGNGYNSGLAAGKNGVAFIEKDPKNNTTSIVVVENKAYRKVASTASQLAWSPDGDYLAAGGSKKTTDIYNNVLGVAYLLPNQNIAHPVWSSEKSLVYSVGNIVWSYSLPNQESKAIASLPANQSINGAVVSSDQAYLYFSGNTQLLRVGLKNQTTDSSMVALGAFLPGAAGIFSFNYFNFTKPTITIQYTYLEGSFDQCVTAAKGQLRYYGLDPSKFQYIFTPPDDYTGPPG